MNDLYQEAKDKLEREAKAGSYDRYASAMKSAVLKTLTGFCKQNNAFADKVIHGGSFEECMKAVAKNCGSSISDAEAYRRAVAFYWKGADIRVQMEIVQGKADGKEETNCHVADTPHNDSRADNIIIDLTDFL